MLVSVYAMSGYPFPFGEVSTLHGKRHNLDQTFLIPSGETLGSKMMCLVPSVLPTAMVKWEGPRRVLPNHHASHPWPLRPISQEDKDFKLWWEQNIASDTEGNTRDATTDTGKVDVGEPTSSSVQEPERVAKARGRLSALGQAIDALLKTFLASATNMGLKDKPLNRQFISWQMCLRVVRNVARFKRHL